MITVGGCSAALIASVQGSLMAVRGRKRIPRADNVEQDQFRALRRAGYPRADLTQCALSLLLNLTELSQKQLNSPNVRNN